MTRLCPVCHGEGIIKAATEELEMTAGCGRCDGTGEVADLKVGDRVPMPPKERLKVSPAHWVDDRASSPRGVFTNGRGSGK